MATSGQMQGNHVSNNNFVFVNWQLASQNVSGNYSTINWQMYWHFESNDRQLDNGYANVGDATRYSNGGRVYNFSSNYSTRDMGISSGSFTIGHNGDGTKTLNVASGLTGYSGERSEGSGSWALPTIPRYATITSTSGTITNETTNVYVGYSNPYGGSVTGDLFVRPLGSGVAFTNFATRTGYGSGVNFSLTSGEINAALAALTGATQGQLIYRVTNGVGVTDYGWSNEVQFNVINANPTFADFTYSDTNSTIATLTGNNQILVQGKSTIAAIVSTANKMIAIRGATATNYTGAFDGSTDTQAYSAGSNVTLSLGSPANSGSKTLSVAARDSRSNTTTVSKTVTVVPYASPIITLGAVRVNNFENTTNIILSGSISLLTIAGTNKNVVSTSTGVAYRYRIAGGTWSSWTTRTSATNSTTGNVTTTAFTLNLDNSKQYEIDARIIDSLETQTVTVVVPAGIGAMRIGTDKLIYNKEQPLMPSHVGQILHSTTLTTAGAVHNIYGGTWVIWGVGRTLVGVDTGQSEFNTVEKTGGHKSMQLHNHAYKLNLAHSDGQIVTAEYVNSGLAYGTARRRYSDVTENYGAGDSQNLQPYITAYMWKRTV